MSNKKSAKDLAWDRERAKYQHRINVLQDEIRKLKIDLGAQQAVEENLDRIIDELTDENDKLRYMTAIPNEDLNRFIREMHEAAEKSKKAAAALEFMLGVHGKYF